MRRGCVIDVGILFVGVGILISGVGMVPVSFRRVVYVSGRGVAGIVAPVSLSSRALATSSTLSALAFNDLVHVFIINVLFYTTQPLKP